MVWSHFSIRTIVSVYNFHINIHGGDNFPLTFFLFKALFVGVNILNFYFIYKLFNKEAAYLYGFNPYILYEFSVNGHNDSLLICFVLLAFYFLYKSSNDLIKKYISLFFLTCALLVKIISGIFIPLFFVIIFKSLDTIKKRASFLIFSLIIVLGFIALVYLPFGGVMDSFNRLRVHFNIEQATHIYVSWGIMCLYVSQLLLGFNYPLEKITFLSKIIFSLFYFALLIYILFKKQKFNISKQFSFYFFLCLIFFYLLFFNWFMPWYLVLLMVLLIIQNQVTQKRGYLGVIYGISFIGIAYYLILR